MMMRLIAGRESLINPTTRWMQHYRHILRADEDARETNTNCGVVLHFPSDGVGTRTRNRMDPLPRNWVHSIGSPGT
jgi:hypothetical protein